MGRSRPREALSLHATTLDLLEELAARLKLTPAGVVHLLASREMSEAWEPERQRRNATRRPWTAARVLEEIEARHADGKAVNHAATKSDHPRLVSAAREYFGGWDEALTAAGLVRPPAHGVPELRGLRRVRLARGYSQRALADRAGVCSSQISSYESGKGKPTRASAAALARALVVNLEELLEG